MFRKVSLGLLSVLIVALLAGVVNAKVTIWIAYLQPDQIKAYREVLWAPFKKEYGIELNAVEVPGEEQVLRNALLGGKGPNLVGMAGPILRSKVCGCKPDSPAR